MIITTTTIIIIIIIIIIIVIIIIKVSSFQLNIKIDVCFICCTKCFNLGFSGRCIHAMKPLR